jgi:hypothetical protein
MEKGSAHSNIMETESSVARLEDVQAERHEASDPYTLT